MANEGKRRFQRAWESRLDKKADKPRLIPAMCGAYFNGQKTLNVSGRPDFIWARIRGKTSEVVQVFNDVLTTYWDLPILVYRDPNYPDIWKVYGRDISRYEDWGGVSYMPSHGGQHSFASTAESGNVGGDIVWVFKRQFVPMLVHPEATASMSVYAEADFYYFNGAYSWFGGTGTGDLSAYKPTGAHNAKYLTVYLEPVANRLLVLEGPEFDVIWTPTDPGEYMAVPSPAEGIPLASVLLMTGTNQIGWGEIYDIRNIVSALGTTGAFSDSDIVWPLDNIGVYNWDDGVPQCTGTIIDWGGNLDVSCSGTVLRVDSATASGTIELLDNDAFLGPIDSLNFVGPGIDTTRAALDGTIYVHGQVWWDVGTPLCTGTIIDWGDNLNVSCSGTVIRVDAAAGGAGAGGAGVMNWDDGAPLCTGTIFDWGDDFDVSCSGTVLRIDPSAGFGGVDILEDSVSVTGSVADLSLDDGFVVSATGTIVFVQPRARFCVAYNTTTQSIANQGEVAVYNSVSIGEDWWVSASGTSMIWVPFAGIYQVNGGWAMTSGAGGDEWVSFGGYLVSGDHGAYPRLDAQAANYHPGIAKSQLLKVGEGGYVTMVAGHDSGSARTIEHASLSVHLVGVE